MNRIEELQKELDNFHDKVINEEYFIENNKIVKDEIVCALYFWDSYFSGFHNSEAIYDEDEGKKGYSSMYELSDGSSFEIKLINKSNF